MAAIRRFRPIRHLVSTPERCPKAVLVREDDQEVLNFSAKVRSAKRQPPIRVASFALYQSH
jgi:hypothetical protein